MQHIEVMQIAKRHGTIALMAETKRRQDEYARQNLLYVIQACSESMGSPRGGLKLLADLSGASYNYLSAVRHAYDDRTIGKSVKTRIEKGLKLGDGWMDTDHGPGVVSEIVRQIPSRPRSQRIGTPKRPQSAPAEHLESTIRELQKRVAELESRQGPKPSTRK